VARLGAAIWTAALALVSLVPVLTGVLSGALPALIRMLLLPVWLALVLGLAAWGFFWPGLRYRYASYRVSEQGLEIRSGVMWRSEVSVPRSRVQHTDVTQGPIARSFGLATLVLHTAGTEHAAVSLGGLAERDAQAIRDFLIEMGEHDDAV